MDASGSGVSWNEAALRGGAQESTNFRLRRKVSYFIGSFLKPNKPQPTEMYHKAIHLLFQYKDVNL